MTAKPTRTLNPLHFEDLEPHRFEDLVRQLCYQHRTWNSIEAVGRLGADEGVDIKAIEVIRPAESGQAGDERDEALEQSQRSWFFQCKREKSIGPSDARTIVASAIPDGSAPPDVFVLAAACDFSTRTRNTLREDALGRGVRECHFWGKAELEDMLFLPANDHLLFAYFDISLKIRRRSRQSTIRTRLATKRALIKAVGSIVDPFEKTVFIRDADEDRYPYSQEIPDFAAYPRWFFLTFVSHQPPDHLLVSLRKHFAYLDDAGTHWDAIFAHADEPELPFDFGPRPPDDSNETRRDYWKLWQEAPSHNQAFLHEARLLHYDRILAVDEDGDSENGGPHLFVEFDRDHSPFVYRRILLLDCYQRGQKMVVSEEDRVSFFPDETRIAVAKNEWDWFGRNPEVDLAAWHS